MSDNAISEEEIQLEPGIVFNEKAGISLSREQQEEIVKIWTSSSKDAPPSLKQICLKIFGKELDVRHPQMKILKKFLATKNFSFPTNPEPPKEPVKKAEEDRETKRVILDGDQMEYFRNNYKGATVVEMCRVVFNNSKLQKNDQEVLAAAEYLESLDLANKPEDYKEYTSIGYKTPRSIDGIVTRIKKYVDKIDWDVKNLNEKQRKCAEALMNYLGVYRYRMQILSYDAKEDRELFESGFIRCTYDKPDLTEEDVDQYIIYSNEVVISKNISRSINKFQEKLDDDMDGDDDHKAQIKQAFVEAISTMRNEYNASIKRQGELLKVLTTKRSDRINKLKEENANFLHLVQAFKEEDFRKKTVELAQRRQELLKEEINKFMTMDEVKSRIFGITEDDIFNG